MANQFTLKNGGYEPFIGNYGLVPQPPIPEPDAEDNGKVIGVSDGQYALVSGGGGGSVEPLIVNVEYDSQYEAEKTDKTCKEIYDAYMDGRAVIWHTTINQDGFISIDNYTLVNASKDGGDVCRWYYFWISNLLRDDNYNPPVYLYDKWGWETEEGESVDNHPAFHYQNS